MGGIVKIDVDGLMLYGGIHTQEVHTDKVMQGNGVEYKGHGKHGHIHHVNINNYVYGDNDYILSWLWYKRAFNGLMKRNGVKSYLIKRVDYMINSYDVCFNGLFQLNNAVALGFGAMRGYGFHREPMYTPNESINTMNGYELHAYCYDRTKKRADSKSKTRYEFKCFNTAYESIDDLRGLGIAYFVTLLRQMAESKTLFKSVQRSANKILIKRWHDRGFSMFGELVRHHKGFIFTASQSVDLCRLLKDERGERLFEDKTAYQNKSRQGLTYIKQSDYQAYLSKLSNALWCFFTH